MTKDKYPWRDGRPLAEVLADSRNWLVRRRIIEDGGGSSESAIAAAEARLGRPLPQDIRTFHRLVQPVRIRSANGPDEFAFYTLEQKEIRWEIPTEATPAEDWRNAEALLIGQNHWGDTIFRVSGHRTQPDGCIGIFDHELAIAELQFAIMARSLAEFVAKTIILGGVTGAFAYEVEDDDGWKPLEHEMGLAASDLVSDEYAELNPSIVDDR